MSAAVTIAADLAGVRVEKKTADVATMKDLSKKVDIQGSPLPYFQIEDNRLLSGAPAIAEHLIRGSAKAGALLGEGAFAEAKVEQFVAMASSSILPAVKTIEDTVFGTTKNPAAHAAAVKSLKEVCKVLNTGLQGKAWIAGDAITFADVYVFVTLVNGFQLALDGGFRKAMPALAAWFEKVARLPVVVKSVGYVKPCQKALPPAK